MSDPENPLSILSNEQLYLTQLSLALHCGRSRSSLKGKHREVVCQLFEITKIESRNRNVPSPAPPYKA